MRDKKKRAVIALGMALLAPCFLLVANATGSQTLKAPLARTSKPLVISQASSTPSSGRVDPSKSKSAAKAKGGVKPTPKRVIINDSNKVVAPTGQSTLVAKAAVPSTRTSLQESKSKTQSKEKSGDEDIDNEITNAKMRAEAGSKSRFSVSGTISYSGATIKSPFSEEAPNPQNLSGSMKPVVYAAGDLGLNVRLNKNWSLGTGAGWTVKKPFHGAEEQNMSNPSGSLNATYKMGPFMMSSQGSATYYTDEQDREEGRTHSFGLGQTFLAPLGDTRFSLGLALSGGRYYYDLEALSQYDYSLGAYPFGEFAISDRFILRSVVGFTTYHLRGQEPWTYYPMNPYQTLGLGVVITRDIFWYVYLRADLKEPNTENTTLSFYLRFNIF